MPPSSEPPSASPPHRPPRRSTSRERAFVLGGLALALPVTAILLVLDMDRPAIGLVWLIAVAWTALAGIAAAIRSAIVHGGRSAFAGCGRRHDPFPDTRAEGFDWDTRTGQFAHMRIDEDRERLLRDDYLRNHDHGI